MPYGIYSPIRDNGIGLSGGQRQRLALARSFYRQAKLLVLDEATSALDNKTERLVIESIFKVSKDIMIIMVAHRLSTLDKCSQIIEIKDGKSVVIKK